MESRDDYFPSLRTVARGLELQDNKALVSGSDVPRLHREGRIAEILAYNALDVQATTAAYRLMTSSAEDLD